MTQADPGDLMSGDDFHVHGAHDHAVEHGGHGDHGGGGDSLGGRIAVLSAVLATMGALMSFAGGDTQAKAQLFKNNAAITKTKANDAWGYYQAKGVKANLAGFAASLSTKPDRVDFYKGEADRYKKEQAEIKAEADKLEQEVKEWDARSDEEMHVHHRWALGATAMQISIALAAIALLSRRTWLLYAVGLVSVGGLVFGGMALAGI
jgi:Domain of unknown function (DUF4337)